MPANDNTAKIYIIGDASGVKPAIDQTETSLAGLGPILSELNASVQALTARMTEGFAAGAASAKQLAVGVEEANAAASHAGASFGAMSERIHMGGLSVGIFEKALAPIAEAVAAAFAIDKIAEFIDKMAEAAEKTEHLAQTFGMSVGEIQQLQGMAIATGIPIEVLTKGMQILDRNMATAATGSKTIKQAMDAVGLSMNDGRSQMEKLAVVADKFKNMDDGPKKVALAMQLFGRSGAQLIPILNLGSQGIEQMNQKMEEYGVKNDQAVAKGVALAENVNETKLGFMGISNVLMDTLAPAFTDLVEGVNSVIKAFIQSYQEGGTVYIIFTTIADVVTIVIDVIKALGAIFGAVWDIIYEVVSDLWKYLADVFGIQIPKNVDASKLVMIELRNTVEIVKDAILLFVDSAGGAIRLLAQTLITFGKIAYDAFTLNWGVIEGDWNKGMSALTNIVHEAAKKVEADAKAMSDAIAAAAAGKAAPGTQESPGVSLPKGSGDFDYNPTGGGKKKKAKDDLVQKLEEELEEKITAWNKEQVAQGTAQEYSLESIADYWAKALARTDLSAKDRYEIQKKYNSAEAAVQKEAFDQKLEGYKRDIDEADKNAAAKLEILQREAKEIAAHYGAQSKEAIAANEVVYQAEKAAAEQRIQLEQNTIKAIQEMEAAAVSEKQKNAELDEQLGRISKGKLLAEEREFENELYQIDLSALQKRKALIDPMKDPIGYQQICQQIEALERQHQQKLNEIDRQAALQRTQIERTAIQQVSQSWGQNIGQMLTMQESFSQGVQNMWQGLVQAIGNAIGTIIENWLTQQLSALIIGDAQHKASAVSRVMSEAGVAGAAGTASMAAAPFPIDLSAPAFGASMAASAASYVGLASFDVGAWNLSKDQMAMVHSGEMIIPANLAGGMRELFKIAGGGEGSGAQTSIGGHTFNYSPTINHADPDLGRMLNSSDRDFRRFMQRFAQNNVLSMPEAA